MTSDAASNRFDCVKWTRATRDRIHKETAGMSHEERRRWREARIRKGAPLAELFDRRTPPGAPARPATRRQRGRTVSRLPWQPREGQEKHPKEFDCVKWTRETRDRLNRKMATMTWHEIAQWLDGEAEKDPSFSRIPKARIFPPRPSGERPAGERRAGERPAGTGPPRAGRP